MTLVGQPSSWCARRVTEGAASSHSRGCGWLPQFFSRVRKGDLILSLTERGDLPISKTHPPYPLLNRVGVKVGDLIPGCARLQMGIVSVDQISKKVTHISHGTLDTKYSYLQLFYYDHVLQFNFHLGPIQLHCFQYMLVACSTYLDPSKLNTYCFQNTIWCKLCI